MKINLPVQNVEAAYPAGQVLVSKTDLKGIIVYANDAFIEISGFEKDELIGKSHNIVRHPDMPSEAFEDLWDTVKRALPWKGVVKNRCKDGRYYWVSAFVVPIFKNGVLSGYMSVRTEPSREQVVQAEALYRRIKDKQATLKRKQTLWESIPLKARFMGALGSILLSLFLIGGLSTYIIESMQIAAERDLVDEELVAQASEDTLAALGAFKTQVQEWKNILLRGQDVTLYAKYLKGFTKEEEQVQSLLSKVRPSLDSFGINPGELDTLMQEHKLMGERYRAALANFDRNSASGYQKVDKSVQGMDRAFTVGLDELVRHITEQGQIKIKTMKERSAGKMKVNRILLLAANIFAIVVAALMFRMLMQMMGTIRQMIAALNDISHGKLDNDIPTDGRDELGMVLASLAAMQVQLRVMMDELRLSVQTIFQRLTALDRTAQETQAQSNSQHARVVEVSAAMELVAMSVSEVANNAAQVLGAAQDSLSVVNEGSTKMHDSLNVTEQAASSVRTSSTTINELNNAVQQISGITKVIKEIADQTNLLALNAAIEAARAGEQGRGFAVVADEVRKLAERTGSSTTDITNMLEQIIAINTEAVKVMTQVESQVNDARQNLQLTEASFGNIREGSQQVAEMAKSIADATQGQASANQAVAQNMEEMSLGVEKTSQLVNELHEATAQLNVTAEELKNMLLQYNVQIR